jgi:urea transport system permease protein
VLAFPEGLAGLYIDKVRPWVMKRLQRKPTAVAEPAAPAKRSDPPAPPATLPPGVSSQKA